MLRHKKILFLGLLFAFPGLIHARDSGQESGPPSIGNFALPPSQQPGTFLSFGENIIDQGMVQFYLDEDAYIGKDSYTTDITPNLLYGITDDFSLFLTVPFAVRDQ